MAFSTGKALTQVAALAWSAVTGKPTTIAGYGITDAVTPTGTESIGNGHTVTLKDTLFTLQDDADTTKQAQFQLSGITTGTTLTYTLPNVSGTLAVLSGIAQTFANTVNFSNTVTMTGGTVTLGNGTGTGTFGLGVGVTSSGNTKTVNIGTSGASGSTTTISIGPVSGAGTATFNSGLTLVTFNQAIKPLVTTVSGLPSASTAGNGARAHVRDASAPTFGATVTGGGSTSCPVYSDGTNWKVG